MTNPFVNYLISEIRQVKSWDFMDHDSRVQMGHILAVLDCGITSIGHDEMGPLVHGLLNLQQRMEMARMLSNLFKGLRRAGIYAFLPPRISQELFDKIYDDRHHYSVRTSEVEVQSLDIPSLVERILTHVEEGFPNILPAAWLLHHVFPHIPIDGHYTQRLNKILRALKYPTNPLHGWYTALQTKTVPSHEVVAFLQTLESKINVPPRKKKETP